MKPIILTLKPNVELQFEAYCKAKGMPPEDVLGDLVNRLVTENQQFILGWITAKSPPETSHGIKTEDEVPVYKIYKGKKYEACFSRSRKEINFNGRWMTPSRAATEITHNNVNGWRNFWRFTDEKGHEQPISKFQY